MKIKILLSILALGLFLNVPAQNTIELSFTAIDSAAYIQLDSIKVMNRTQGFDTLSNFPDTVLYYPDTVLVLECQSGISENNINNEGFRVFRNYPNPVVNQTTISLYIPEKDHVILLITDVSGRLIIKNDRMLEKGFHSFRFTPGNENLYFCTAYWRGNSNSIKMLHTSSHATGQTTLEYTGSEMLISQLKATAISSDFPYNSGDELLYIGYYNTLQSGIMDTPETSGSYSIQFATNIPCPGMPTVEYEGQVYNTIQIFGQCWLKENLNVGTMIPGQQEMIDNDTIEKYCYNNEPDSCTKYGGLYAWDEMMQYTTQTGTQGICPPGWHLPTDEDWKVLEGAVDIVIFGIGSNQWDAWDGRGWETGKRLITTYGWIELYNGIDMFGFSALPGGYNDRYGFSLNVGFNAYWWTTSVSWMENDNKWSRMLGGDDWATHRDSRITQDFMFSVRCLRYE